MRNNVFKILIAKGFRVFNWLFARLIAFCASGLKVPTIPSNIASKVAKSPSSKVPNPFKTCWKTPNIERSPTEACFP